MDSDDKGNPQIPEIKYSVNLEQKEGKIWQAFALISPTFEEPWPCESSFILCHGSMHQEFPTKFRVVVAFHHQQECSQHQLEEMLRQALASLFAGISHCVWKLPGIFPNCVVFALSVIHNQPFSIRAGAPCRIRTCFPFSSKILDLFFVFIQSLLLLSTLLTSSSVLSSLKKSLISSSHIFFGFPTAQKVLYFRHVQGSILLLSLPIFLPVKMQFSSLISISLFCVFIRSIASSVLLFMKSIQSSSSISAVSISSLVFFMKEMSLS